MSIAIDTAQHIEHRCRCGKLLCKGFIRDGIIEIKCKRCGELTKITPSSSKDRPIPSAV